MIRKLLIDGNILKGKWCITNEFIGTQTSTIPLIKGDALIG